MTYVFNRTVSDNAFRIRAIHGDIQKAVVHIKRHSVKGQYLRPWGGSTRNICFSSESALEDLKRHTEMSDCDFNELKSLIESGKRIIQNELSVCRNATSVDIAYRYQSLIVTAKLNLEVINGVLTPDVGYNYMITSKDTTAQWSGDLATLNDMESYHKIYNHEYMPADVISIGRTHPSDTIHPKDITTIFKYAGFTDLEAGHLSNIINVKIDQLATNHFHVEGSQATTIHVDDIIIRCYRQGSVFVVHAKSDSDEFIATWRRYTKNIWVSGTFKVDGLPGTDPLEKIEYIFNQTFLKKLSASGLSRLTAFTKSEDIKSEEPSMEAGSPHSPNKHNLLFDVNVNESRVQVWGKDCEYNLNITFRGICVYGTVSVHDGVLVHHLNTVPEMFQKELPEFINTGSLFALIDSILDKFNCQLDEGQTECILEALEKSIDMEDEIAVRPRVSLPVKPWLYNQSGIEFEVEGFVVSDKRIDRDPYAYIVGPHNVRDAIQYMHDADYDECFNEDGRSRRHRSPQPRLNRSVKIYLASYNGSGEVELSMLKD